MIFFRLIWFFVGPILSFLAIPLLLLGLVTFELVFVIIKAWYFATDNPRYDRVTGELR